MRRTWRLSVLPIFVLVIMLAVAGACHRGGSLLRPGGEVDAERIYFAPDVQEDIDWPEGPAVLRSPADVRTYFGPASAADGSGKARRLSDMVRRLSRHDFRSEVLMAFTTVTGCDLVGDVTLWAKGREFSVRTPTDLTKLFDRTDCDRAYKMAAVFAVPRDRVPANAVLPWPPH
ncbi:hypothetical protein [Actinomadura sp. 9N407]|uniref:hypothetical protein n=1 Tax=Actinomadura sp. 9N407 TaxID=3375154 RepID=UPI0037A16260